MIQPRDALAALSGVALVGAFAPLSLSVLTLVAPALLLVSLQSATPRRGALRGFLFGFGLFGTGVHWVYFSLHDFGSAAPAFAAFVTLAFVVFLALFPAALGWLMQWISPRPGLFRYCFVFPALWITLEWLRERLLTGFPWLSVGSAQIDGPLAGWLPILGALGVGGLIALGAGCLVSAMRGPLWKRMLSVVLLLVILVSGLPLFDLSWTEPVGERIDVALVQGNIPQDQKWLPEQRSATLSLYRKLTLAAPRKDLVVWPETAVPALRFQVLPFLDRMAEELGDRGGELIYGVATYDPVDGGLYNSVGVAGDRERTYHKHHLVPFGEYLPLRDLLTFFRDYVQIPMSDFSAGLPVQPALEVDDLRVGVSICYEAAFAEQIRGALPEAELLVNVSNDAWFGTSLAPHQHLEIARVRAAETGRAMLRATNTGISAVIDHRGRVLGRTRQFETAVLEGEVFRRQGSTPFVRYGQMPILGLAVLVLLAGGAVRAFRAPPAVTPASPRTPD